MTFMDVIKTVFTISLLYSTIRIGISILFAGMGEMVTERSGVLNIGIEGVMLMGAWAAAIGSYFSGNAWVGLLCAVGIALIIGAIFAYIAISLKSSQAIAGLAITLLATGLSGYFLQIIFEHGGNTPRVATLPIVHMAFLEKIPFLNGIFNDQSILMIPALLLPLLLYVVFYHTPWGSWLRATGENPKALAVVGINPITVRYVAVLFGAAMAGIGGAYLSISQTSMFSENMVAGRGFIALAAVIFGNVKTRGVFLACL